MSMYNYEKMALDIMRGKKDYSNERKVVVNRGGVSLPMVLFIVFLVLKLTNTIDWSWWWVLSPFWLYPLIATAAYLVIALYFAYKKKRSNKR